MIYETSDIYFASYINTLKYELKLTKKVQDGRKEKTVFCFDIPDEEVEEVKSGFFGGGGKISALEYQYSIRSLKSLCFIK